MVCGGGKGRHCNLGANEMTDGDIGVLRPLDSAIAERYTAHVRCKSLPAQYKDRLFFLFVTVENKKRKETHNYSPLKSNKKFFIYGGV